ncbi:type VII secretion-associated serine protease mycosin [Segniliparus rugosus]|uniref:Type VII secretion-associated serine protease mycosin n=1 Tax=Segniliparus rugosus (strain ATCC BAA-974 / DSM 45345 / CCUG 50838 / CIP 108380 / JCM 13579 / CDC 945) TaxID=679197 RepID=U1LMN3_SEGRC|nr:type VII secretion-associated serine protease mycosin [Segniliparus rugosus]ERG69211.1 type VII secretion-associated serine protease mycosin [Segniliparus rugosus ATCC BAA-974]
MTRKPGLGAAVRRQGMRATAVGMAAVFFGISPIPGTGAPPAFADNGVTGPPQALDSPPSDEVSNGGTDYEQKNLCRTGEHQPDTNFKNPTWGQRSLDLDAAHRISTGEGVSVAVIDTGVTEVKGRLEGVEGGGDYIRGEGQGGHGGDTNGLDDCDLHGTFAAGIIAAKAKPGADSFVGVAPDAHIISIRQSSDLFGPKGGDNNIPAGTLNTLAHAVVHAANKGAQVINISIDSCFAAGNWQQNDNRGQDMILGAALKYAAEVKDAVVVVAAGNLQGGSKDATCKGQNPDYDATQRYDYDTADPAPPTDPGTPTYGPKNPFNTASPENPANWTTLQTVVTPAWWYQYVLTVGWVDRSGQPAGVDPSGQAKQDSGTIGGPWVGIAAPGDNMISVNPRPGEDVVGKPNADLADATPAGDGKLQTIQGTSFAAPIVAGAAALLRSLHPDWNRVQVIEQLERTAIHPPRGRDNYVGYGLVDIVAALTQEPGPAVDLMQQYATKRLPPPVPPALPEHRPRNFAIMVSSVALLLLALGAVVSIPIRDARRNRTGGKK